jgi:HlyD family secretion protein
MKPKFSLVALVMVLASLLSGCDRRDPNRFQGYIEGEYVYVASPYAGQLQKLWVSRGMQVKSGEPLFALESTSEQATRDEAERRRAQAQATLDDLRKGQRPTEIAALESQLQQARAAVLLSEKEFARQQELHRSGASSTQDLDRARSARDQDRQRVATLEANLQTAQLGSRVDQVMAAEANVRMMGAALVRADWDLAQKRQAAPQDALVFDTLFREGEWVPAGRPVVSLLPPGNVKVRTFVPEGRVGSIHPGDTLHVSVDGVPQASAAKVSFISPKAEYTPPVIYSQDSRAKLVFMIEAVFDPTIGAKLHPGQPVDVELTR